MTYISLANPRWPSFFIIEKIMLFYHLDNMCLGNFVSINLFLVSLENLTQIIILLFFYIMW